MGAAMDAAADPWGLSEIQAQTMDQVVIHGCDKRVARVMGLSKCQVQWHVRKASQRMGMSHRVQMAVAWDRYRRGLQP